MPPTTRDEIQRYCNQMLTAAENIGSYAYEVELAYKQGENLLKTKYKEQRQITQDIQQMCYVLLEAVKVLKGQ